MNLGRRQSWVAKQRTRAEYLQNAVIVTENQFTHIKLLKLIHNTNNAATLQFV